MGRISCSLGLALVVFLKSDLIDLWSEDPIDCDIPHYPLFNGDPELNQIQGLEGAQWQGHTVWWVVYWSSRLRPHIQ